MRSVKLFYNHYGYELVLASKVAVVLGDSASGKTRLCDILTKTEYTPELVSLKGVQSIGCLSRGNWERALSKQYEVLVVDESTILEWEDQSKAVHEMLAKDCYFIIISRGRLSKLPFGVHNLYDFESVNDSYCRMVPHALSSSSVKEFLALYKATFGEDFSGRIPPEVFGMLPTELTAQFPDLMVKLYNRGDIS